MIKIKTCKFCKNEFIAAKNSQKYCSSLCRCTDYNNKKKTSYINGQLCWNCKNACGNCSWSESLTPVKGWTAKKVKRKDTPGYTYSIKKCPLFVSERVFTRRIKT